MAEHSKENKGRADKPALSLTDRAFLCLNSVDEVLSFDEGLVSLSVGGTTLSVSGAGLSVVKLSLESGEISISGRIDALVYSDERPQKGFFSKLFG